MPDTQMLLVLLLFAIALIAGYFYLKRAQRRDAAKTSAAEPEHTSHEAAAEPAASPEPVQRSAPAEEPARSEAPPPRE